MRRRCSSGHHSKQPPRPCCWRHPAGCRRNTKIMQTDPTARHSPIGSFQRADYLVHLARDPVATARGVRSPALHPDRHCARHRLLGAWVRAPGDLPGLPRPYRATWAGSPAGSLPTGPRLNAPSSSPSGSAASTPPRPSWAPPGRRCASLHPPRPGHAARNPEAVRQRTIAAARRRSGRPATPGLDPVFVALNLGALPAREQPAPSCMHGSAATRSTPSWALPWWSSCTARAGPANQPPGPGRSSAGPTAATG
jgi:hypothetical protein